MRKLIEETEKADETMKKTLVEESGITGSKGESYMTKHEKLFNCVRKFVT